MNIIPTMIGLLFGLLIITTTFSFNSNELSLPDDEYNNAKQAYAYHIEKIGCETKCGPHSSLAARMWINEYRKDHNLTYNEFLCAVWYNDMEGWFYY